MNDTVILDELCKLLKSISIAAVCTNTPTSELLTEPQNFYSYTGSERELALDLLLKINISRARAMSATSEVVAPPLGGI